MDQAASMKVLPRDRRSAWLVGVAAATLCVVLWLIARPMLIWSAVALGSSVGTAVCATALFLLPGLALLRLFWPGDLPMIERWPLAIGMSCASIPMLVLFGSFVGLRWNTLTVWLLLGLALLVLLWPARAPERRMTWHNLRGQRPSAAQVYLLLLTALALALRLYLVRDLPAGMFGDSYHHTMITQLLIDHGGLFESWEPYAPLRTMTYHYGFHSVAAFLSMLTGLPATTTTLVIGQIEGALAVPMLFLLTLRLLRNQRTALFAALLVACVSIMPAYYVNWGRYTQLGGQTALVAVVVAWMALLDGRSTTNNRRQPEPRVAIGGGLSPVVAIWSGSVTLRLIGMTAFATAGLALTHYRVAVFAACFVVVYCLYCVVASHEPQQSGIRAVVSLRQNTLRLAGLGTLTGLLTGVLVVPWLLRLREGALLKIGGYYLSNSVAVDAPLTNAFNLYVQPFMAALAVAGLVLLLWRREWRVLVLPTWAAVMWVAANPALIGLPGTGILSGVAVLIASYLVLVPLAAAGLTGGIWLACSGIRRAEFTTAVQFAAGIVLLGWGLNWQQHLLTPQTQLLYQADVEAFDWITHETPADARLFVNSFSAFGGGVYVGSDGGWWLPLLTGRTSNVPPAPYGTEAGERVDYQMWVKADNELVLAHDLNTAAAAAALKSGGYTYLYDGPGNTAPRGNEYIRPAALANSPWYQQVYQRGGVTIWKVR